MYVIYVQHTSFCLYHCNFPQSYLRSLYHTGEPTPGSAEVALTRSKEYDFANTEERAEWFEVFVALVQYLLSGESKVGYLNDARRENPVHKVRTTLPLKKEN